MSSESEKNEVWLKKLGFQIAKLHLKIPFSIQKWIFFNIYFLLEPLDETTNHISAKLAEKWRFEIFEVPLKIPFSMLNWKYLKNGSPVFAEIFTPFRGVLGAVFGFKKIWWEPYFSLKSKNKKLHFLFFSVFYDIFCRNSKFWKFSSDIMVPL